jgi:hypothetical protein
MAKALLEVIDRPASLQPLHGVEMSQIVEAEWPIVIVTPDQIQRQSTKAGRNVGVGLAVVMPEYPSAAERRGQTAVSAAVGIPTKTSGLKLPTDMVFGPARGLPAADPDGEVWLNGKPRKGGPLAPASGG